MGFFTDLKEDLSQAVNELMPEDQLDAVLAGDADGTLGEEAGYTGNIMDSPAQNMNLAQGLPTEEKTATGNLLDSVDLDSMLDMLGGEEETGTPGSAGPKDIRGGLGSVTEPDLFAAQPTLGSEPAAAANILQNKSLQAENPMEETGSRKEMMTENIMENITDDIMENITDGIPEAENDALNFSKGEDKMDVQVRTVSDETAVVTAGMTITGDISSEGSLELIGSVNGNIDVLGKLNITGAIQGNSKAAEIYAEGAKITGEISSQGSVKIGQSSVVIGNIAATSAVIAGAVKGDIDVHGPVILDTSAIVMGNIKSKSVQINNGAVIEGMCSQCYADVNPSSFFEDFKKKKGDK